MIYSLTGSVLMLRRGDESGLDAHSRRTVCLSEELAVSPLQPLWTQSSSSPILRCNWTTLTTWWMMMQSSATTCLIIRGRGLRKGPDGFLQGQAPGEVWDQQAWQRTGDGPGKQGFLAVRVCTKGGDWQEVFKKMPPSNMLLFRFK